MYHYELKPFRTNQWEKEVEKIFDAFSSANSFAPACEVLDQEKDYFISMDVPGLSKDDIDIEVKENQLVVTGERTVPERNKDTEILRAERRYGKFHRVFNLPQNVNSDGITARFENGVLDIHLPKEEKALAKKIPISTLQS
jgi:HSP20 family protein